MAKRINEEKRVANDKTFKKLVDYVQQFVGFNATGCLVAMLGDVLTKFTDEGHKVVKEVDIQLNGITSITLDCETMTYKKEV